MGNGYIKHMSISFNADAMQVAAVGMSVTANNIANMNTDGFHASSARYTTGPNGRGVRLGEIREDPSPGPLRPGAPGEADTVELSNTDVAREMVNLISDQRMYQANAVPITVYDEMSGTVLDIVA